MAGIGITVEQLDRRFRPGHEGVVDMLADDGRAHRHSAIGQPLGAGDHVGGDAEGLGRAGGAEPPESADHLIEDQ